MQREHYRRRLAAVAFSCSANDECAPQPANIERLAAGRDGASIAGGPCGFDSAQQRQQSGSE
jgi:hypothetical protein